MIPEMASQDEELLVKFVDNMDSKGDDENKYSKANLHLLQASINNFQFQTPNPNYYSTLGQFKMMNTPGNATPPMMGGSAYQKNIGLMSTMVGTNTTNQPMLLMQEGS